MKKYISILLMSVVCLLSFSSCLKSGLEDFDEYEGNDITAVQYVQYAFVSGDVSNASGQNIVKYQNLTQSSKIDADNATITIDVTVPAVSTAFPEAERTKCSTSNVLVIVQLSTAARLTPLDGAPKLGISGDWSKPNKYRVTAANGATKDWTITISSFNK